ncbi:HlyD family secretion protein [Roseateles amylovorans]|uniref:HlyD family secretion protein n=1 Tax=Roseateles amylovorans TaxID=2978473 RepID=A0ABY6B4I0_9BURK|nr:HlyD family secretion protein [Roseateles amylovorans]UXH79947.1 HlyD family secretion protein [Roseateles amylovorans]
MPKFLRISNLLVASAALGGIALVLYVWRLPPFHGAIESTENAYVRGSVTVMAAKVDGYVTEVLVQDFAAVEAGQVLVRLDGRHYVHRLEQARAALAAQRASLANVVQARHVREAGVANAQAQLAAAQAQQVNADAQWSRAQADHRRSLALVGDGSVSQREHEQTESVLRQTEASQRLAQAQAQQARAAIAAAQQELRAVEVNREAIEAAIEGALAAVHVAELDLEHTRIRAPRRGHVGEIGVKLGQYVTPGAQLLALVPAEVWVVANFKEDQASAIAPGQSAWVQVDGLGHARLKGRVERLSPAMGSEFSFFRPDNATGNFTKVPQRMPVRIAVDADDPLAGRLRPGMSVIAEVDTGSLQP